MYQYIVNRMLLKIKIVTFCDVFCIFLGQENKNVHILTLYITRYIVARKMTTVLIEVLVVVVMPARLLCVNLLGFCLCVLFLVTSGRLYTDTLPLNDSPGID